MGALEKYEHFHEKSSQWFRDKFMRFSDHPKDDPRDVHHHKITDKATGRTGEGWGWSYRDAEKKAWDDLKTMK